VPPRGSLSNLDAGSPATNWVEAPAGAYTIRHLDTLYNIGPNSDKATLYTGYLPLQITPKALGISWGKSIGGLSAGLEAPQSTVAIGTQIYTNLYIKNTGRRDRTIRYIFNNDKFFVPKLTDSGYHKLLPDWKNGTIELKLSTSRTLKPGEMECVAHPLFTIAAQPYDEHDSLLGGENQATWFVGRPGEYRCELTAAVTDGSAQDLTTSIRVVPAGTRVVPREEKPDWSYYPSGEVGIKIVGR
jgi:hypothetical protein